MGRTGAGCLLALALALTAGAPAVGQDLTAPDPGGRENAIVKVPPPGKSYLGVHEPGIVGGSTHGWTPRQIARLASGAGAEILRFTIDWSFVEPVQDVWDRTQWARYTDAYQALVDEGIKPLIGISTAPPWARDFGVPQLCGTSLACTYPPRPEMTHEWAEFAGEVARRFPRTAAIEIWNEPNHSGFWKPTPQPERYASLVSAAYDAIKAERPRIAVLAGALAGADTTRIDPVGTSVISINEFLSRAYVAPQGIAGKMDGISFHQASQKIRFGEDSQLALAFQGARAARRTHDIRRTPLWITEFGLSTTDGDHVDQPVQADALLRAYRKVITMRDVGAFVIHTLGDRVELEPNDRERGVGLIRSWDPFVPKRAFCAFAGRAEKRPLGGCSRVRESRVSRCTYSLVRLHKRMTSAPAGERRRLKQRLARKTAACVSKRGARRLPPARCLAKLTRLQLRHITAIATLRLDILNRHERVLRRCR